jgi:outer membrane protein insertion porin family
MNKTLFAYTLPLFLLTGSIAPVCAHQPSIEAYEHKRVAAIEVEMETASSEKQFNQSQILNMLKTKVGDPFSQNTFDQDLKDLSEEYDRAIPYITMKNGELYIKIKVWQKPMIQNIKWEGNHHVGTSKLQKELGIKAHTNFNRDDFNRAFNKVKEFYIKKGFFEAHLQYTVRPIRDTNKVDVVIHVEEGRSGHVEKIDFEGFTKPEESDLMDLINTKKYNFFTSWLTGRGKYHEEALDHDKMIILDFLQNRGYADAKVDIEVSHSEESGRIIILVKADRGEVFHIGGVTFSGNALYSNTEIEDALLIHKGDIYSPEEIRETVQSIKNLYGKKGYIEANIHYELNLSRNEPMYNVHYDIEENEQYKIGLIRVLGNKSTNTNVILRESLLVPGEVFDSRKLKATENRLEAVGYFKSVNVYSVRAPDDRSLGANYRDVVIEVNETSTGSISLFFGFSSMNRVFGGLDITENNFDLSGLWKCWTDGASAFRGAGEYAHVKASIGSNEQSYVLSWLTPYLNDSRWQFGFDVGYSLSKLESKDYDTKKIFLNLNATYPLTRFVAWGLSGRISNAIVNVDKNKIDAEQATKQERNSGLVVGFGGNLSYNSTNSSYKASRGLRSTLIGELAGIRRHSSQDRIFPFVKTAWVNSYYYPVYSKGTLKFRADVRYTFPLGDGTPDLLPISERYFLGGETSVRGFRTYTLGPKFKEPNGSTSDDPVGGVSSHLASVEYLQNIIKPVDLFVFFDGGAISINRFDMGNFRMSYGGGIRLEVSRNMPVTIGYGIPINPGKHDEEQRFFFAMGAQW